MQKVPSTNKETINQEIWKAWKQDFNYESLKKYKDLQEDVVHWHQELNRVNEMQNKAQKNTFINNLFRLTTRSISFAMAYHITQYRPDEACYATVGDFRPIHWVNGTIQVANQYRDTINEELVLNGGYQNVS